MSRKSKIANQNNRRIVRREGIQLTEEFRQGLEDLRDIGGWNGPRSVRRVGKRRNWIAYKTTIARIIGRPIGKRMAESWVERGEWTVRHTGYGAPAVTFLDARPVREMYKAGLCITHAVRVTETAEENRLWGREENRLWGRYGSPKTIPALIVNDAIKRRIPLKAVEEFWKFAPATEWNKLPSRPLSYTWAARVYARTVSRDGMQKREWFLLRRCIRSHREHGLYAGILAIRELRNDNLTGYWPDRPEWKEQFWTEYRKQYRKGFAECFDAIASPQRKWRRLGIKIPGGQFDLLPPAGAKGKLFRALAESGGFGTNAKIGSQYIQPMLNLVAVFADKAPKFVELFRTTRRYAERALHDAGQFVVPPPEHLPPLREFVQKNWRMVAANPQKVIEIINGWNAAVYAGLSWKAVLTEMSKRQYGPDCPDEIAVIAAELGMPSYRMEEVKSLYAEFCAKANCVLLESIPAVEVQSGEYRFRRLDRYDFRGLVLGLYTDCCQHPWGAGSPCAWHGVKSGNGAFFVVEKNGKIIAQSWAWRSGDVVVMDNIEALGGNERMLPIYKIAANKLIGRLGIKAVHVGTGHDDAGVSELPHVVPVDPVDYPHGEYRDSHSQRFLANEQTVLEEEYCRIESECYPEEMQTQEENIRIAMGHRQENRLIHIVRRGGNPVGYVVGWKNNNANSVEIADLAILPEYRRNLSVWKEIERAIRAICDRNTLCVAECRKSSIDIIRKRCEIVSVDTHENYWDNGEFGYVTRFRIPE